MSPLVMARDTIWIVVANILAAYEITDPVDVDGKKLTADDHLEYTNAMVRYDSHGPLFLVYKLFSKFIASRRLSELQSGVESRRV